MFNKIEQGKSHSRRYGLDQACLLYVKATLLFYRVWPFIHLWVCTHFPLFKPQNKKNTKKKKKTKQGHRPCSLWHEDQDGRNYRMRSPSDVFSGDSSFL
ncbi:unnamed protein product [Brassica oleracea]|uniref:Uncharacterized protein n=1 Tax=Brassica oleracea TaxID=3712 RepID=A0A3P6GVQ7_BRAOL|nr:unnamed protein product [Brassica oleracea]